MTARVGGVLLAAGASKRMGTNKMLIEVGGETLVRAAARRALDAGISPVVVVLGHEAERVRRALAGLDLDFAVNPDFAGPSGASFQCGLRQLPDDLDAAVVMLADMVGVTTGMLAAVAAAADAAIVASRYAGVMAPPFLFQRSLFAELLAWEGPGPGKGVVERHPQQAIFLDWPAARGADVDKPEDLSAA